MADGQDLALLEQIHDSAPRMVMEFAGAGSRALWLLHSVGGSSRTILEATDRYAPRSVSEGAGFTPERFTSPEVARALAERAQARADDLAAGEFPTFGLGLSATIATDRAKRGEHRCELAVCDAFGVSRYAVSIAKGERDREGEEELVSALVLYAVAQASGVLGAPQPRLLPSEELLRELEPRGMAAQFEDGRREWLLRGSDGHFEERAPSPMAILSGSFNPVHGGHLRLARAAEQRLGNPVLFELPLVNAEKAGISLAEVRLRASQFLGKFPVILSRSPLFSEKAKLFPGVTFVVGFDTASRLLEPRFYGSEEGMHKSLSELAELGASFLVAGRRQGDRFRTLADLHVPSQSAGLFKELSEEEFREDISSSELRRRWAEGDRSRWRSGQGPETGT